MATTSLFEELFEAAKSVGMRPYKATDIRDEYLTDLAKAIYSLPETKWVALSLSAKQWYNDFSKARNTISDNPLPSPQGFLGEAKQIEADDQTKSITNPPSTTEIIKQVELARTQSSVPNVANKPKEKSGVLDAMRKVVLLHPDWSARKVYLYLKDNGWPNVNLNTMAVEVGNTKRVIDCARSLGLMKDDATNTGSPN